MTIKVLLIEDDRADAALFKRRLGAEYSVRPVTHLSEAISLLSDAGFDSDIVVTDIGLPDANGLNVLSMLRATGTALPIVAITGLDRDGLLASNWAELGLEGYINKDHHGPKQMKDVLSDAMLCKWDQFVMSHMSQVSFV